MVTKLALTLVPLRVFEFEFVLAGSLVVVLPLASTATAADDVARVGTGPV
jgi:hypothetical protein